MTESERTRVELWKGLRPTAIQALTYNHTERDLAVRLSETGIAAGELLKMREQAEPFWIPGVEIFSRTVHAQPSRGFFGEFARSTEGALHDIGLWPRQWATARMFGGTAKGFHIHPPHLPAGVDPAEWFQRLFVKEKKNFSLRPYDKEQWDAMFFVQGIAEMVLVDERPGLERRIMRFTIYGDDYPGPNNVGVVIPAGVAHAIRCGSNDDLIMVYGTSTTYEPQSEGRIAHGVESAPLPQVWLDYMRGSQT